MTSLSVLVPAYNEQYLVAVSLARLEALDSSPHLERIQIIVVDDCSNDGTAAELRTFATTRGLAWRDDAAPVDGTSLVAEGRVGKTDWVFLRHARNGGKGAAIRTALAHAQCAITVIHDSDLEYNPRDLERMVRVFLEEKADAVFGSRFAGGEVRRALLFRHELGNRLITFLTNCVTNLNLTDIETCYKAVRTDLLRSIPLVSNDFRLEPELAIKLAKRGARIFEVPISYAGRTYQEGKKINWRDGFGALSAIVRFGISDNLFNADEHGSHTLNRLSRAPRFNAWMGDVVRPHCGQRVLEIGAGTGNLTRELVPRELYYASDINPLYLDSLRGLTHSRPYLNVALTDVTKAETFPQVPGGFDTVVCLNVIEHVEDDRGALENIRRVLAANGRAVILVPHGPQIHGTLDEVLGHRRRYTPESLQQLAEQSGFSVRQTVLFNRTGWPAWWLNGKVLKRKTFGLGQIVALNTLTPVFRRIDERLPFPPLSIIAILEPRKEEPR
jgi:glycosyltransferase involved in cell wall biosynthesis/phospholipid N-methyltransferase